MSARHPLPPGLPTPAFRVGDAHRAGVPPHRLRASDVRTNVTGVRSIMPPNTLAERCALFALRMPIASFFSHTTAAQLYGMPVPYRLSLDPRVHIAVPAPARAPHARGLVGHALGVGEHELCTMVDGLRVTTPIRTWFDLAHALPLLDLVAAGDYLLHGEYPMVEANDLVQALGTLRNRRIRRKLLRAADLLDPRAESAPESILRTLLMLAGIPVSRVNHSVTDRFGEFVARTDLIIDRYRVILEYQGDYHRTTKGQWRADMTRRARLEAEGWRVMELNADDLTNPVELVRRIRTLAQLPQLPLSLS
ncbi:hypothetical protein [Leifsonia kafniensis]